MATIELTKENFEEVLEGHEVVLIDFWADWCGPCRMFGPIFEQASEKYPDIAFVKCDTGAQQEIAAAFNIRAIPTLAVLREKVMVFFQAGALPGAALDELISKVKELDMDEIRAEVEKENGADGEADDGDESGG